MRHREKERHEEKERDEENERERGGQTRTDRDGEITAAADGPLDCQCVSVLETGDEVGVRREL